MITQLLQILFDIPQQMNPKDKEQIELQRDISNLTQQIISTSILSSNYNKQQKQKQYDNQQKETIEQSLKVYKQIQTQLKEYCNIFNSKPKKVLEEMINNFKIQPEQLEDKNIDQISNITQNMALFFRYYYDLQHDQFGEILGGNKPINAQILKQYIKTFDFKDLSFVDTQRVFFSTFLMKGEFQVIERILCAFNEQYFLQNQHKKDFPFDDQDQLYAFGIAFIMLQSDLHNKINTEKMSLQDWIKQGRLTKKDFTEEFLTQVYRDVEKLEIKACRNISIDDNFTQVLYDYMQKINGISNNIKTEFSIGLLIPLMEFYFDKNLPQQFYYLQKLKNEENLQKLIAQELLNELLLQTLFSNLDNFIAKFQSEQEQENLSLFIENIIDLCIQNEKIDSIEKIFKEFYKKIYLDEILEQQAQSQNQQKNQKQKKNQKSLIRNKYFNTYIFQSLQSQQLIYIYACMIIASKALNYIYDKCQKEITQIFVNTTLIRYLAQDSISNSATLYSNQIKQSIQFFKSNIHNNKSFVDFLSGFIAKEDSSDEEENNQIAQYMMSIFPQDKINFLTKIYTNQDLAQIFIDQTKELTDNSLQELINQLIENLDEIKEIEKNKEEFTHQIYFIIQIVKVNHKRLNKIWEIIQNFFKLSIQLYLINNNFHKQQQNQQYQQLSKEKKDQIIQNLKQQENEWMVQLQNQSDKKINIIKKLHNIQQKKINKKSYITNLMHFSLLDLTISFIHLSVPNSQNNSDANFLTQFDLYLDFSLQFLIDSSLEIYEYVNLLLSNIFEKQKKIKKCDRSLATRYSQIFEILIAQLDTKNIKNEEIKANTHFLAKNFNQYLDLINQIPQENINDYFVILQRLHSTLDIFLDSRIFTTVGVEPHAIKYIEILLNSIQEQNDHFSHNEQYINEINKILINIIDSVSKCAKFWPIKSMDTLLKLIKNTLGQIFYQSLNKNDIKAIFTRIRLYQYQVLQFKHESFIQVYYNLLITTQLKWLENCQKDQFEEQQIYNFVNITLQILKFVKSIKLELVSQSISASLVQLLKKLFDFGFISEQNLGDQNSQDFKIFQNYSEALKQFNIQFESQEIGIEYNLDQLKQQYQQQQQDKNQNKNDNNIQLQNEQLLSKNGQINQDLNNQKYQQTNFQQDQQQIQHERVQVQNQEIQENQDQNIQQIQHNNEIINQKLEEVQNLELQKEKSEKSKYSTVNNSIQEEQKPQNIDSGTEQSQEIENKLDNEKNQQIQPNQDQDQQQQNKQINHSQNLQDNEVVNQQQAYEQEKQQLYQQLQDEQQIQNLTQPIIIQAQIQDNQYLEQEQESVQRQLEFQKQLMKQKQKYQNLLHHRQDELQGSPKISQKSHKSSENSIQQQPQYQRTNNQIIRQKSAQNQENVSSQQLDQDHYEQVQQLKENLHNSLLQKNQQLEQLIKQRKLSSSNKTPNNKSQSSQQNDEMQEKKSVTQIQEEKDIKNFENIQQIQNQTLQQIENQQIKCQQQQSQNSDQNIKQESNELNKPQHNEHSANNFSEQQLQNTETKQSQILEQKENQNIQQHQHQNHPYSQQQNIKNTDKKAENNSIQEQKYQELQKLYEEQKLQKEKLILEQQKTLSQLPPKQQKLQQDTDQQALIKKYKELKQKEQKQNNKNNNNNQIKVDPIQQQQKHIQELQKQQQLEQEQLKQQLYNQQQNQQQTQQQQETLLSQNENGLKQQQLLLKKQQEEYEKQLEQLKIMKNNQQKVKKMVNQGELTEEQAELLLNNNNCLIPAHFQGKQVLQMLQNQQQNSEKQEEIGDQLQKKMQEAFQQSTEQKDQCMIF